MKKYKLIKTYPGSPELGYVITVNNTHTTTYYSKYSEFWQEIVEKDYEILSFKSYNGLTTLRKNGRYVVEYVSDSQLPLQGTDTDGLGATLDEMLTHREFKGYTIHSVKRLSDGEIFTVGDKIETGLINQDICIIYGFEIDDNKLKINHTHSFLLNQKYPETYCNKHLHLLNKRKSVCKTEDGIDIYEGDNYFTVKSDFKIIHYSAQKFHVQPYLGAKLFSSREKAEEYIIMNKPCLSINDVLTNSYNKLTLDVSRLEQLVKSKL
jgi:hypothetical protein